MTRQKKELMKKIDMIEKGIILDMQLSCGCYPSSAYDTAYEEIYRINEELARLSHYDSVEAMLNDDRWMVKDYDLPFS